MQWVKELKQVIKEKSVVVGIVGLGYIGLPLAVVFSKKCKVFGYDMNSEKIGYLKQGESYIEDVESDEINKKMFYPTCDYRNLGKCDFIIITVPTPLRKNKTPDLSYIKEVAETVSKILKKGQFVILESTTYPGTTKEILVPILEKGSGLKIIEDFGVAYSPERVDLGNKKYKIENTPKVVGGLTSEFTEVAANLYSIIVERVIKVKDCETAEAVKMVENVFRNVNIALINELALIFENIGIDIWPVIEAAKTKPYGFMAFYPGPGVGGHCIPLDPYYISYRAKQFGIIPKLIETAGEINDYMPIHIVNLVDRGFNTIGKKTKEAKVAVLGLAYKANIGDTRESPAIRIIEKLVEKDAKVRVYDPNTKSIKTRFGEFYSEKGLKEILKWAECVVFITAHTVFKENLAKILTLLNSRDKEIVIIDGVNILNNLTNSNLGKLLYLKLGAKNG
jgi:UDP-N-acetyl-D-glucosamine dehydrogenase